MGLKSVHVCQDAHSPRPEEHKYWHKMEQMCVQVARGALPMIFRPTANVFTAATDAAPSVPQGGERGAVQSNYVFVMIQTFAVCQLHNSIQT